MADDGTSSGKWKDSKAAKGLRAVGQSLSQSGQDEMDRASSERITPVQYKRGGKVRKTGGAVVHKDERVIPKSKRKSVERLMKKAGMKLTDKTKRKKDRKDSGR